MLRSIRLLSIGIGLFSLATAALARSYNWKDNPPPVEVFESVLEKLWAASAEPEPFLSIRGKRLLDRTGWSAKLILPGARHETCWLPLSNIQTLQYTCLFTFKNVDEAQRAYANLAKMVQSSRGDWIIAHHTPKRPLIATTQFSLKGEFGQDEAAKPGLVRQLLVNLSPNQCVISVFARWVK